MYLTAERLKKRQTRMSSDFTNEPALFVEIHSLKVVLIAGEDLIGLWNNPDLKGGTMVNGQICNTSDRDTYLGAIIFNDRLWEILDRFSFEEHLFKQLRKPLCLHSFHHFVSAISAANPSDKDAAYHNDLDMKCGRASRPRVIVDRIEHERTKQNATLVSE